MGEIVMNASIITTIVLCFIGLIKLPFKPLKVKYPKVYRTLFYALSLILTIGLPVLCGLFIMHLNLKSLDFYILIISVIAGVFGLYSSYEGIGLKALVNTLFSKLKELCSRYTDSALAKTINKVGIEKLNEIAKQIEEAKAKAAAEAKTITETTQNQ